MILLSNHSFQSNINYVVCFLLGESPASEIYMPTFRNTLFHLHRQVGASTSTYLPMKMGQTECSETSAYKFPTPGIHPKESIQHSVHGESLKSRLIKTNVIFLACIYEIINSTAIIFKITSQRKYDCTVSSSSVKF